MPDYYLLTADQFTALSADLRVLYPSPRWSLDETKVILTVYIGTATPLTSTQIGQIEAAGGVDLGDELTRNRAQWERPER